MVLEEINFFVSCSLLKGIVLYGRLECESLFTWCGGYAWKCFDGLQLVCEVNVINLVVFSWFETFVLSLIVFLYLVSSSLYDFTSLVDSSNWLHYTYPYWLFWLITIHALLSIDYFDWLYCTYPCWFSWLIAFLLIYFSNWLHCNSPCLFFRLHLSLLILLLSCSSL